MNSQAQISAPRRALAAMEAAAELGSQLVDRSRNIGSFGSFIIELPCVATVRALALAGFDFVIIDMEHSTISFDAIEPLILAAQGFGLAAFVRVWGDEAGLIGKALEAGANGLLIPHVGNARHAEKVVREARFPPFGERSFSPLTRYDALSQSKAAISAGTIVLAQIEGADGLAAAAEIASTPGIDGIFLGPHDLSLALNISIDDPALANAASELAARVPDASLKGVYVDHPEASRMWRDLGFRLQCVGFDGRMLADAAASVFDAASGQVEKAA